jgi:hypothetical protein
MCSVEVCLPSAGLIELTDKLSPSSFFNPAEPFRHERFTQLRGVCSTVYPSPASDKHTVISTYVHERTSATVTLVETSCSRLLSHWSQNLKKPHYGKIELLRRSGTRTKRTVPGHSKLLVLLEHFTTFSNCPPKKKICSETKEPN